MRPNWKFAGKKVTRPSLLSLAMCALTYLLDGALHAAHGGVKFTMPMEERGADLVGLTSERHTDPTVKALTSSCFWFWLVYAPFQHALWYQLCKTRGRLIITPISVNIISRHLLSWAPGGGGARTNLSVICLLNSLWFDGCWIIHNQSVRPTTGAHDRGWRSIKVFGNSAHVCASFFLKGVNIALSQK